MDKVSLFQGINIGLECGSAVAIGILLFFCFGVRGKYDNRINRLFLMMLTTTMIMILTRLTVSFGLFPEESVPNTICGILLTAAIFMLDFIFTRYLIAVLPHQAYVPVWYLTVILFITVGGATILILEQVMSISDFSIGAGFLPLMVTIGRAAGVLVYLLDIALVLGNFRVVGQEGYAMIFYMAFPLLGLIGYSLYPAIRFHYPAIVFSVIFLYLVVHQKREDELHQNLVRARADLVVSQMSPHLVFNTLNSIYYLCDSDPDAAKEGILQFSAYLRDNLDALKTTEPVPFSHEMKHIDHYLMIQKMRYGDLLQSVYDIEEEDFRIPVLSVEPLVENAVRHGLAKKENGGTVTVATRHEGDMIRISVSDDGIGFQPETMTDDGTSHLGIQNSRSRIESIPGASFAIESEPGRGTTVTILIPRRLN